MLISDRVNLGGKEMLEAESNIIWLTGQPSMKIIAILNMYSIDNRDIKRIKQKVIKLKGKIEKLKLSTVLSQQLIELDRKSVNI